MNFIKFEICLTSNKLWRALLVLTSLLLLSMIQTGCSAKTNPPGSPPEQDIVSDTKIVDSLGIEVVAMRQTAGGNMLDFRFRVHDVDKAVILFKEEVKPQLIDLSSGVNLAVPITSKLGPMRPTYRNPKKGIVYWMLFNNPEGLVKEGGRVAIIVGEYRIDNIVVE